MTLAHNPLMSISQRKEAIWDAVKAASSPILTSVLMDCFASSRASLNRDLKSLAEAGLLLIQGKGRSTRYSLGSDIIERPEPRFQWSQASTALFESMSASLAAGTQAHYVSSFLADYTPNLSSLLPPQLALHSLFGRIDRDLSSPDC